MTSDRGTSGGAELELNNTPVTPKSPALNPNASVFLSVKSSTPGAGPTDTGQFDPNDSGIASTSNSASDYSYINGDISTDKADAVVFSPTSDSPFQSEFTHYTDNHNFNENNSSAMKLEEKMGNLILDSGVYGVDTPAPAANFSGELGIVPMTGIQYSSENGSATDGETEGSVPDDQLRLVLKTQLESTFSRENLSNDSYLQSQMDADQYVPIATVASLDQIQKLSSDTQLIVKLLRESTFVQVDEKGEKVRPNHNRCIVILREIPESTPVQDVQGLFSGVNCPKFVSCEFAHNSNWYVTFDSDADAQRAYQYLREEVRTFLGKPIMARIKAKPLIRTYQPRNMNKRFQQPPVTSQLPAEVVSSSAPQPQFTATQPFTLMPNVSQYLNGQQAMPFYPPPPSQLLQAYPTIMDPSMVLAMNGYHATSVNVNSQVNSRNMYNTVSRTTNNNTRNQKQHGSSGQPMGRDRINSNDSLPPRLQHQQHQQHERNQNANNNMHKTSQSISNHAPTYQGRRGDGPGQGHISHSNHSHHSHHGNHSHPGHSTQMSHHQHQPPSLQHHQGHHVHQQSQHLDGNNNNNNNVSNGAMLNSRNSQGVDLSQRYAGKSYKSRRRREEDGARPNRSSSSQLSTRDGQPVHQARPALIDKFDYEPTSFPPLPGSGNNASSGDVFESKLSDVVKGTAKPQVKDVPKPVSSVLPISTATTTVTTSKPSMPSSRDDEITPSSISDQSSSLLSTPAAKTTTGTTSQQPTVSQQVRSSASTIQTVPDCRAGREPDARPSKETDAHTCMESDSRPVRERQQLQQQQSNTDDNTASLRANSVKLSYAQMVQKTKVAEVSANSLADPSDESEGEANDSSQAPNRALKEQGQHPTQSSSKPSARGSIKDFSRKDSRENDGESRRDEREFRKENDYRRDEPREQRINRRLKENRERRYAERERDFGHRNDRRVRDGPPVRERDSARPPAAAAI